MQAKLALNLQRLGHAQIEQLTGLRWAAVARAAELYRTSLGSRGRPPIHGPLVTVVVALMKMRLGLSVRALEALTGVDSVTASRCVNRCARFLAGLAFTREIRGALIVDSTSTRVASTDLASYSGYKHHRCAKVQVVCDEAGTVLDVSPSYAGSVHDKTIFDREAGRLAPSMKGWMLADKAYVGAAWEGQTLLRPIKRGEQAYRLAPEAARIFNRTLSRIRVKVEHCFARLKTWRVLQGLFPYRASRYGEFVKAIAMLHNLNRGIGPATDTWRRKMPIKERDRGPGDL